MSVANVVPITVRDRAREKLKRDFGSELLYLLSEPTTFELSRNSDGKLWLDKAGCPKSYIGDMSDAKAESIIKTVAAFCNKEVTRFQPLLDAKLPINDERFTAQIEPVVASPTFSIRTKASQIFTLDSYVENRIMTSQQCEVIKKAIKEYKNILVVGGTGSGKTTLVNSIIDGMVEHEPLDRIIIIEDTNEIQCKAENHVQYHATADIDMTRLVKTTLRMRPDRILVGEVRGPEALDLLDAWNTGHEGGVATLHANDALSGITRLRSLISRNLFKPDDIEPLIAEVVHLVIFIEKKLNQRKVSEIFSIEGYQNNQYNFKKLG